MSVTQATRFLSYDIEALLADSAGVRTYSAVDTRVGKRVRLTVVEGDDLRERERLWRQARVLLRLEHELVAMLHDCSAEGDDQCFLALSDAEGVALDSLVQRVGSADSVVIEAIAAQAIQATCVVHAQGIVLRQLSLASFWEQPDGRLVLADLSHAAVLNEAGDATQIRLAAPEQGDATEASDMFALASVLSSLGSTPSLDKLLGQMRNPAPAQRPTAEQCLQDITARVSLEDARQRLSAWWERAFPVERDRHAAIRRAVDQGDLARALALATEDRFALGEPLGQGGIGQVFLATDQRLQRTVAVKFLRDQTDRLMRERFHREARALARLRGPNILSVLDYGGRDAPLAYLVTEFVDGATLGAVLKVQLPDVKAALALATELASALSAVARAGLVHRDIKPDNVFLDATGRLVLGDFGIVKGVREHTGTFARAGTQAIGSPGFSAPEQVFSTTSLTEAADVFAFASVVFALFSGQSPFAADSIAASLSKLGRGERARWPTSVPPALSALIDPCFATEPASRPAMANVLEGLTQLSARAGVRDRRGEIRAFLSGRTEADSGIFENATRIHREGQTVAAPSAPRRDDGIGHTSPLEAASSRDWSSGQTGSASVTATSVFDPENLTAARHEDVVPVAARGRPWLLAAAVVVLLLTSAAGAWLLVSTPARPATTVAPVAVTVAAPPPAPIAALPPPTETERLEAPELPKDETPAAPPESPRRRSAPATIRFFTKPWAKVVIDGEVAGTTPILNTTELAPGKHRLRFEHPGFNSKDIVLEVKSGEKRDVEVLLTR